MYCPSPSISHVCKETVRIVSECPRNKSEHKKLASEKCSKACGNSEGDIKYKYHCLLDSTNKDLLEMCAIPKYLFDYCPAYDRKGYQIQKDESRPCNTSSSRTYYNSSELFFCDLTNCLDSFAITSSDSPSETTNITTTQMSDGESWHHHLIWITPVPVAMISLMIICIIFWIRKRHPNSTKLYDCLKLLTLEKNGG